MMEKGYIKATYAELLGYVNDTTVEKLFSLQAADMNGKPAFISAVVGSPTEWAQEYAYTPVYLTDEAQAVVRQKVPSRADDIINKELWVKSIAIDWNAPAHTQQQPTNKKKWIIGGAIALAALALLNNK